MTDIAPCIQCGKMTSVDITMCCDGYMCGCKGLPIHPPLCEECEKTFFKHGMKEFHLHKYPVTSVEGNEYAVSIYNDRYSKGFVKVSLYKKVRGFFRKEKFKCLTREGDFAPSYFEAKWDYNYIQMAINEEVIIYENSHTGAN